MSLVTKTLVKSKKPGIGRRQIQNCTSMVLTSVKLLTEKKQRRKEEKRKLGLDKIVNV